MDRRDPSSSRTIAWRLSGAAVVGSFFSLGSVVASAQSLPKLEAKLTNLGDLNSDGVIDLTDVTVSDVPNRARNTYSFAKLDASVGWDVAFAQLKTAHPEMSHFVPIAVVEGNFMLTDPPVDRALVGSTGRRIIRGSGGLRLYLVRSSATEAETASFSGYNDENRTFRPKAGSMQTAENLAAERPQQYGFLANVLPHPPMSVRQVKAFKGYDGFPWLVCGCSTAPDDFDPVDLTESQEMKKPRVFRWNTATASFIEVAIPQFDVATNTWGVEAGDLNLDGVPDLVLGRYKLNFLPAPNKILLGRNNGTFELIDSSYNPFLLPDTTTDIEAGDLDADGYIDIVVANRYRLLFDNDSTSRDYVLWGSAPVPVSGGLSQPVFSAPNFLEADTDLGRRDTVAVDIADVDHDGDLDIVAGNHGVEGGPFVEDNTLPPQSGGSGNTYGVPWTRNYDVIYEHQPGRVFQGFDLPWTGSPQGMTTDIMFIDAVGPNRTDPPASGTNTSVWNMWPTIATRVSGTTDSPWVGGLADGFPEILRLGRSRSGTQVDWFLNDTNWGPVGSGAHSTFEWYFDGTSWVNHPEPNVYAWRFARASTGPVPWVLLTDPASLPSSYFVNGYNPGTLYNYKGLIPYNLDGFIQTAIAGDFVPDHRFTANYVEGVHWPANPASGAAYDPDILIGMGYELSGVPNRLYPFCARTDVLTVGGGEYAGLLGAPSGGGSSFTSGWTEYTSKGYGITSVDIENDGDFDIIAARRTGAMLYENKGNPVGGTGTEGKFEQEKNTKRWPALDTPYSKNISFREDACAGDFDQDGDQDVMLVGFSGIQDFNAGYTRGERDEDTSQHSWLEGQTTQNDRMFQGTQFLENLTVGGTGSAIGGFSHRSDRLDFNGRTSTGLGGDRGYVGDFDGDGDLDMIEPCWATIPPSWPGYAPYSQDPSNSPAGLADWNSNKLNYDNISTYKSLAFRYWQNQGTATSTWLKDVAASKIKCRVPSTGVEHFGPLDARGGTDWSLGTAAVPLHLRNHVAQTFADYNNDGFLDMCVGYGALNAVDGNGYNMYLGDTNGNFYDATPLMPSWANDTAAPNGKSAGSFCFSSQDFDQDGDVDLFVTFANSIDHATRLLENTYPIAPSPPPGWSVPTVNFVPRTFAYGSSQTTGWVESLQRYLNWPPYPDGNGNIPPNQSIVQDSVFWLGGIDLDLDGDQDIAQFTAGAAHRFLENKAVDASPRDRFLDRSSDLNYTDANLIPVPSLGDVLNTMRITAHRGALPVDFEVADYTGDGLQDIVADYNERPLAFYKNSGVLGLDAGLPLGSNATVAPIVSRVVPELGVTKGETLRLYGKRLRFVFKVELLFGDLSNPTIETIQNGSGGTFVVPQAAGRFLDVTIPQTVSHYGPFAIRVTRTNGGGSNIASVTFQSSGLTLVKP